MFQGLVTSKTSDGWGVGGGEWGRDLLQYIWKNENTCIGLIRWSVTKFYVQSSAITGSKKEKYSYWTSIVLYYIQIIKSSLPKTDRSCNNSSFMKGSICYNKYYQKFYVPSLMEKGRVSRLFCKNYAIPFSPTEA